MFLRSHKFTNIPKLFSRHTSETWNLRFPASREIETTLPKVEEQREIARCSTHRNLIALHQREA
jgi:restriction endonuclease S subunit